nr:MAG TPA: hypothetical protein [Caudoviricetes sp.]
MIAETVENTRFFRLVNLWSYRMGKKFSILFLLLKDD